MALGCIKKAVCSGERREAWVSGGEELDPLHRMVWSRGVGGKSCFGIPNWANARHPAAARQLAAAIAEVAAATEETKFVLLSPAGTKFPYDFFC